MSSLSEVIREAYALSKSDEVILETIELRWRDSRILLVSNFDGIIAMLETGENPGWVARQRGPHFGSNALAPLCTLVASSGSLGWKKS